MDIARSLREVAGSPYYRRRPLEVVRYAYAKWLFSRFRLAGAEAMLTALGVDTSIAFAGLDRWLPLLEQVLRDVERRAGQQGGVSRDDGLVLYGLVRALRPEYVIETGVAAGVSTSFASAALIENRRGVLYSVELPPGETAARVHPDGVAFDWPASGVGWAIPDRIRQAIGARHVLILEDVRTALPALLQRLPHVDIFFHDDLHTPDHMRWEYELVWPRIRPGGVLVSDDVNFGWVRFCRGYGLTGNVFHNVQRLAAIRKP